MRSDLHYPMGARPFSTILGFSIKKGLLTFIISSLVGASAVIAVGKNTHDQTKNINRTSPSLNKLETLISSPMQALIPMPSGQLDKALAKVESTRDPFQEAPVTESSNINLLRSALEFNGIAKSGDNLLAIIKTEEGQKFYKVGDRLENGFFIEKISDTDITADISNGIKNYRLALDRFMIR